MKDERTSTTDKFEEFGMPVLWGMVGHDIQPVVIAPVLARNRSSFSRLFDAQVKDQMMGAAKANDWNQLRRIVYSYTMNCCSNYVQHLLLFQEISSVSAIQHNRANVVYMKERFSDSERVFVRLNEDDLSIAQPILDAIISLAVKFNDR